MERTGFIVINVGASTTACNAQNHRSSWFTSGERELPALSEVGMALQRLGTGYPPRKGPQVAQDLFQLRFGISGTQFLAACFNA